MKNKFLLIAGAVLLLAAAGFFIFTNIPSQNPPASDPTKFNLIFRYGITDGQTKNELNTFTQTYTKDMILDRAVTKSFKLSDAALAGIEQKIKSLRVFTASTAPVDKNTAVTPCSSYYLKAQIDSMQKELSWDDCHGAVGAPLQEFTTYIIQVIESSAEYKKFPEARGGYL